MRQILFAAAAFLAFAGGSAVELDSTLYLSSYPSKLRVEKLIKEGKVTHLVISGRHLSPPSEVAYPSGVHVRNLNLLGNITAHLDIDVSNYPSASNQADLSKLLDSISVNLTIRNCLSQTSEAARLERVRKSMDVQIFCSTERQVEEAQGLAIEVMQKNELLRVQVFLIR